MTGSEQISVAMCKTQVVLLAFLCKYNSLGPRAEPGFTRHTALAGLVCPFPYRR